MNETQIFVCRVETSNGVSDYVTLLSHGMPLITLDFRQRRWGKVMALFISLISVLKTQKAQYHRRTLLEFLR